MGVLSRGRGGRYNPGIMATDVPDMTTLGVVSFLNSRPLIEGLNAETGIGLYYAVPSALPGLLGSGQVDAALVPVIDWARAAGAWDRISDGCIGCDGETLTVRVFSRVPPEEIRTLYVDPDSHTSVALAQVLWTYYYERRLTLLPMNAIESWSDCEAVLLIGDKVVNAPLVGFEHEIDLGGAWKAWQGLPFVFAIWAAPAGRDYTALAAMLSAARDRGVERAADIARVAAPALGWPVDLALRYMTEYLRYTITPASLEGMQRFFDLAAAEGIIPETGVLA